MSHLPIQNIHTTSPEASQDHTRDLAQGQDHITTKEDDHIHGIAVNYDNGIVKIELELLTKFTGVTVFDHCLL